jgi:hypothetical protein
LIELTAPVRINGRRYVVEIEPQQLTQTGQFELEVRLQFGHYPGGLTGQPCPGDSCAVDSMLSAYPSLSWSGQLIGSSAPLGVQIPSGSYLVMCIDTFANVTLSSVPA